MESSKIENNLKKIIFLIIFRDDAKFVALFLENLLTTTKFDMVLMLLTKKEKKGIFDWFIRFLIGGIRNTRIGPRGGSCG